MVVVEFGRNITSVFFMLILGPNFDDALAKKINNPLDTNNIQIKIQRTQNIIKMMYVYLCTSQVN